MRIYGSETLDPKVRTCLSNPDAADLKAFGRGDWGNKAAKAAARRILKRAARRAGKAACRDAE